MPFLLRSRKLLLGGALLVSTVGVLLHCQPASQPTQPGVAEDGFPRDTLVIALPADVTTLIPVLFQETQDLEVGELLFFPPLLPKFDCALTFQPGLAKDWSFSEDGLSLTMNLRDDIRWSDGQPVTAADLAFAFDLVADPAAASPLQSYVERMDPQARPQVVNEHQVVFRFTERYDIATMLTHAGTVPPLPAHVLAGIDRQYLRGHEYNEVPVVNGPWKLARWERGQRIVLAPNPQWSGPPELAPKLARVIFKIVSETATGYLELAKGDVDLLERLPVTEVDRLASEGAPVDFYRRGLRSVATLGWNLVDPEDYARRAQGLPEGEAPDLATVAPHPLFGDVAVRRALTQAIDVDSLIQRLYTSKATGEAFARPAVGTITPLLCQVQNSEITPLAYDPTAARQALAQAGWSDSDGDGVLDKDGRAFSFTLSFSPSDPLRQEVAALIRADLKDIGVQAELASTERKRFFHALRQKDYDGMLMNWSAGLYVDPSAQWHSGPQGQFNFVGYANPEVDRLIELGMATPEPEKSDAIWRQFQAQVYADQPFTFLYWMDEAVAVNARFQDVGTNVISPYNDLFRWWVPADRVKHRE